MDKSVKFIKSVSLNLNYEEYHPASFDENVELLFGKMRFLIYICKRKSMLPKRNTLYAKEIKRRL